MAAQLAEDSLNRAAQLARAYSHLKRAGEAEQLLEQAYKALWGSRPPSLVEQLRGAKTPPPEEGGGWGKTVVASFAKLAYALHESGQLRNWVLAIEGPKGVGKTTYAYNSLVGALIDLGFSPREAREYVGQAFFWDLVEWAESVRELDETGSWVPFIVLDDVGVHGSKYWFMEDKRSALIEVSEALDTVKDVCGLLVMTTPVFGKIASFLREASEYVAAFEMVYVRDGRTVKALWHQTAEVLSSKKRKTVRKAPMPAFLEALPPHARLPDDFWAKMSQVRKEARAARLKAAAEKLKETASGEEELEP